MKRDRIEEIRYYAERSTAQAGMPLEAPIEDTRSICTMNTEELSELCRLALRATDPDMVMVPRERIQKCQNELAVEPVDADADWFDERDGMLIDEMNRWLGAQEDQP